MQLSRETIIQRDEMVFKAALDNKIYICMLVGEGYSKDSWKISAESIENIFKKFVPKGIEFPNYD